MKVRLTVDVDEVSRYVIAKYYRQHAPNDRPRSRASRGQCRRFIRGALIEAIADRVMLIDKRGETVIARLRGEIPPSEPAELLEPIERTGRLF